LTYKIEFRPAAEREFLRLDRTIRERLAPKIDELADNPRPSGCKKLLAEKNRYRIRVGDYRVIYEIRDAILVVLVLSAGHRSAIYR